MGLLGLAPKEKAEGCVPAAVVAVGRGLACTDMALAASAQPQFSFVSSPKSTINKWASVMKQFLFLAFLGQIRSCTY